MKIFWLVLTIFQLGNGLDNGVAKTPPMGFSTWNTFRCDFDERVLKELLLTMEKSGLKAVGYNYFNIDDCWEGTRNARGFIEEDRKKFPTGMKAFADFVHSKDFKFGIYSSSGPKTCQGYEGSWQHEYDDAAVFANWTADFVKLDCCYQDNIRDREQAYSSMSKALLQTARPIVFSCDSDELLFRTAINEEYPFLWAPSQCNMARIWMDIEDTWESTLDIMERAANIYMFSKPGYWNDLDMLTVGMGGQSIAEYRTQFSIWSIVSSPLIIGADLRNISKEALDILTNHEVIEVNQDALGKAGNRIRTSTSGKHEIWAKPLYTSEDEKVMAVVLFNRADVPEEITLDFGDLWYDVISPPRPREPIYANVRDLWLKKDLGVFNQTFRATVLPHDSVMIKVAKTEKPSSTPASKAMTFNGLRGTRGDMSSQKHHDAFPHYLQTSAKPFLVLAKRYLSLIIPQVVDDDDV